MADLSAAARSKDAKALLAWMRALDTSVVERQELLAAGVAPATVESLYPTDFPAIVPGLCRHLRTYGTRGLRNQEEGRDGALSTLKSVRRSMDSALEAHYLADEARQLAGSGLPDELIRELHTQFEQAGLAAISSATASFTASGLWYCWWYMSNSERLSSEQRVAVEDVAQWFGAHLLNLP